MADGGKLPTRLRHAYNDRVALGDRAGFGTCPELGRQWSTADVARYLEIEENTVVTYRKRAARNTAAGTPKAGDLPAPDGWTGNNRGPWWWPETIVRWNEDDRPGQGVGGGRPW